MSHCDGGVARADNVTEMRARHHVSLARRAVIVLFLGRCLRTASATEGGRVAYLKRRAHCSRPTAKG